jgi:hypothetical protein
MTQRLAAHDGGSAARKRLFYKVIAIQTIAPDRHEKIASGHCSTVYR